MSKTKLTKQYEYFIYDYLYLKRKLDCAMEVQVPLLGRADLVGINRFGKDLEITIVEIKTSKADFKSVNGHNFVGNRNYYAMPEKLYNLVKKEIPSHVGVLTIKRNKVEVIKNAKLVKHKYPSRFYEILDKNINVAKLSNIRRLLYQRHRTEVNKK